MNQSLKLHITRPSAIGTAVALLFSVLVALAVLKFGPHFGVMQQANAAAISWAVGTVVWGIASCEVGIVARRGLTHVLLIAAGITVICGLVQVVS